jgi:hypothetical protein
MIKVVSLFLIVIVTLAMFGKLGWLGKITPKSLQRDKPKLCKKCGRHIIGSKGCECGRPPVNKG